MKSSECFNLCWPSQAHCDILIDFYQTESAQLTGAKFSGNIRLHYRLLLCVVLSVGLARSSSALSTEVEILVLC